METISFMSACLRFFGLLPGQTKLQFGQEVKLLTDTDRAEMAPMLSKELGCDVTLKAAGAIK